MQFIIMAYDGNDENTVERRAAFPEAHLKTIEKMSDEKNHLYTAAIQDYLWWHCNSAFPNPWTTIIPLPLDEKVGTNIFNCSSS